ncbi:MAG TPA: translocation/assembly module TamB domain-containing protein, partial [Steroidobacteraceae bacterium]|nr:translocation/assembly module TamB domain-containing protein [Steroidobacteraceae bacterium]
RVNSSVNVKLGDDVRFDGLGLQAQLSGEVNTRLRTGVAASGRGELGVSDGHYEAYGRKLDIKRGRLLFDNTPLDNPGLDIQAERVINDVNLGDLTVGVYVRGVLRDPRLEFYSDPSMSQTQIVSYLVVGKPLDQLQSQETTTVRSATTSLAMQGGGYLAGQLGRRIGLEEVGVETDSNNQSALVLGKFLSPRLFVSYGISLTQAINTLKLRYSVSKHWTLKTEAGEAKSADVEFKIER